MPALLAWAAAWALCFVLAWAQAPAWARLGLPTLLGVALAQWPLMASTRWRAVFVAAGFPLSALALWLVAQAPGEGGSAQALAGAWVWLVPLALLLLAYPVRAWRDAPLFPTPLGALAPLRQYVPLDAQALVLDAGCGVGDGLRALRQAYPQAQLHGVEWSWPWALLCKLRCPWAKVQRGDMWAHSWANYDVVYLFQRPESMGQAVSKAARELRKGAWLVSLEFEAPGLAPTARFEASEQRWVNLYRF